MESLIELETIDDGGDVSLVDDEVGDVRVEGDGEGGQARVGANNAQLVVVTFTTLGKII